MSHMRYAALAAFAGLAIAQPSAAGAQARQSDSTFRWAGPVAAGQWFFVRNLNGGVTIRPGTSDQVEIRAIKSWNRGDPSAVRVEVKRYGTGDRDLLVCALWGDQSVCTDKEYRTRDSGRRTRNNDVNVQFIVSLPRGVNIRAETVNGSVDIGGATAQIVAKSVNGSVDAVSTGGPVEARAVNGNVYARMGTPRGTEDLTYASVNGNVVVEFSGDLDAELEMSTVNGGFETNFPLPLRGRINPRHIRATLGDGGRLVKLSTVNGNVELRKK